MSTASAPGQFHLAGGGRMLFFDQCNAMAVVDRRYGLAAVVSRSEGRLATLSCAWEPFWKTLEKPVFSMRSAAFSGIISTMNPLAELDQLNLEPAAKAQAAALFFRH
jgi:hypothetical protein